MIVSNANRGCIHSLTAVLAEGLLSHAKKMQAAAQRAEDYQTW